MTSVEIPSSVAAALPTLSVFDITNDVSRAIERSEHDSGLAYVAASSTLAVVRVTERESGFFHDFEAMLSRLVPQDTTERERLIVALARLAYRADPVRRQPVVPRPVAARAALRLQRRRLRGLHADAARLDGTPDATFLSRIGEK